MEVRKRLSHKAILARLVITTLLLTLIFVYTSKYWAGNKVIKYDSVIPEEVAHRRTDVVSRHFALDSRQDWHSESKPFSRTGMRTFYSKKYSSEDIDSSQRKLSGEVPKPKLTQETGQHSKVGNWSDEFVLWKSSSAIHNALQGDQTMETFTDKRRRPQHQTIAPSPGVTDIALQGTIRKALKKIPHKRARRNCYTFNDRNRTAYRVLPLHSRGDHKWKQEEAVIFNRVGKCGSRSVIQLLERLSDLNDFNLISSTVYNQTAISSDWQKYIAKTLDAVKTPYLFQRHIHFINFGDLKLRQPRYINIIRDPLARFTSSYYFKRFGDGQGERFFKGSNEAKNRSITDCILQGYKECIIGGATYIIPFFCGQDKACRRPSQWALDQAKRNVEKYFVIVGILEDLENSFKVFEKVLPRFFKGALQVYKTPDKRGVKTMASTVTKIKEKPSAKAAAIMKRLMRYEYDFYNWVKERLEKMKKQYGIGRGMYHTQN